MDLQSFKEKNVWMSYTRHVTLPLESPFKKNYISKSNLSILKLFSISHGRSHIIKKYKTK